MTSRRETAIYMPDNRPRISGGVPSRLDSQPSLLPTRVSTTYPGEPQGKHIKFLCTAADGLNYYCKADAGGHPIRATEWIAHSLARHLGIAVPDFRIMEYGDDTLFGSRVAVSTADVFTVSDFLQRKQANEFGGPTEWLGRRLSGLYVLDMFLNNPDRQPRNFVLERVGSVGTLCAIDFADSHLEDISSERFPVAGSFTVVKGRFLRSVHGFYQDAASEMIDKIRVVPTAEMNGIVRGMPDDWMSDEQKKHFCEAWAGPQFESRLSALRAGLEDGSRL